MMSSSTTGTFFFFNGTATTDIYTLSLHDALPISWDDLAGPSIDAPVALFFGAGTLFNRDDREYLVKGFPISIRFDSARSEEHTSELQSHVNLVCRLLLEKKKIIESNANLFHERYK